MEDPLASSAERTEPTVVYFNGFGIGVGNADFTLQLRLENEIRVVLKCSYTVAKTLAQKLTGVVAQFEKATHYDLLTTEQVAEALEPRAEPGKEKAKDEPKLAK